jgi:hypothetical protein
LSALQAATWTSTRTWVLAPRIVALALVGFVLGATLGVAGF